MQVWASRGLRAFEHAHMIDWPDPHGGLDRTPKPPEYYDAKINHKQSLAAHWSQIGVRFVTWYPALTLCSGRILELGGGAGHFARMALDLGHEYICGIEGGPRAVQVSSERCPEAFFSVQTLPSFGADVAWWMSQADTVVILEVLEHIGRDKDVLAMVPPGTNVVFSVPNFCTKTHCRWFGSVDEITERYGQVLDIERVVVESASNKEPKRWAIVRGTRR